MKIEQHTWNGSKRYTITGQEREPIEIFLNRLAREYPYFGYNTITSGVRWCEPDGYWMATASHRLTCD